MLRWLDILYYAKYSNPEPPRRVAKSEAEWQAQITPAQFRVLRQQGTEPLYRTRIAAPTSQVGMPARVATACCSTQPRSTMSCRAGRASRSR